MGNRIWRIFNTDARERRIFACFVCSWTYVTDFVTWGYYEPAGPIISGVGRPHKNRILQLLTENHKKIRVLYKSKNCFTKVHWVMLRIVWEIKNFFVMGTLRGDKRNSNLALLPRLCFVKHCFFGVFVAILANRSKVNMWNLKFVIAHAQLSPGPGRSSKRIKNP